MTPQAVSRQRGFTLIELLAVMAILAVLVAIVAPAVAGSREASLQAQALQDAMQVRAAANKFFGQVQASEVRTSHTVTTTTLLPASSGQDGSLALLEPATQARQMVSSRWPEKFITLGQTPGDVSTIGAGYADVVQTGSNPIVDSIVVLGSDGKTLAGKVLLERYTAVDLDALATQGLLAKKPAAAELRSDNVPNFLWLFEKTSSSNAAERKDDSRDVVVFKLVKVEKIEGTDNVRATFGQVLGEAPAPAPAATYAPTPAQTPPPTPTPTPTPTSTATPTASPTPTATASTFVTEAWVARYSGPAGNSGAYALAVDGQGNVYVTGPSLGDGTGLDYATIKYDPNGNQLWVARYNGPGNGDDIGWNLAVDGLGNVYVTGWSEGDGTGTDYATIKYDPNGNQLWVARYHGPGDSGDLAQALAVDGLGNVYVTGYSVDGYSDYATIKYDPNGNQLWVARYNGPGNSGDYATGLAVDALGNVYVTGYSVGLVSGSDYATIKYDPSGVQLWVARYNGPGDSGDLAQALAVDGQGNVYVTGQSDGAGTGSDYATIKYDANGNQLWVARYNGPGNGDDIGTGLAVDGQGNVYVTGNSVDGYSGYSDYATIKYDPNGNQLWVARYNGPGNGDDLVEHQHLAVDALGNVYVTGTSDGAGTGFDCATIKYDTNGNQMWVARYNGPGSGYDGATSLVVDGQGNVYVTGFSPGAGTGSDYATIKYAAQ
ncbi:MAG: SBBP repeat-containing protein [Chloroflexi bacterium]|nr:SBBP repeat-containing protein [Chloroflexota bacterium]